MDTARFETLTQQDLLPEPLHERHVSIPDRNTPPNHLTHQPIITSGNRGADGQDGYHGSHATGCGNHGGAGGFGSHGEPGYHAKEIVCALQVTNNSSTISVPSLIGDQEMKPFNFNLGDPSSSIYLEAIGGDGGNGGHGGNGGNGSHGYAGTDATKYRAGGNGGPGGNGGSGGDGGNGGIGGNGANITVNVDKDDTDLLMLIKTQPSTNGGDGGLGGRRGEGGRGGTGGPGGKSYSWNETTSTIVRAADGSSRTQTQVIPKYSPGGRNGPSGRNGVAGQYGAPGANGVDGRCSFNVSGAGEFSWRYDLQIFGEMEVRDEHDYGVLEPGTRFNVKYAIANIGEMDTPLAQDVVCTVLNTPTVVADGTEKGRIKLPRCIKPLSRVTLPMPILAHIIDLPKPCIGPPLKMQTELLHRASVTRVNQAFPLVEAQATTAFVSCALELSYPYGVCSIVPNGEAVMLVDVRNMSNKPIGFDALLKRYAKVKMASFWNDRVNVDNIGTDEIALLKNSNAISSCPIITADELEISLLNHKSSTWRDAGNGVEQNVQVINPGHTTTVACSVRLVEETKAKTYSQACLLTELHLGHPKALTEMRMVQYRPFEVQIASHFSYRQNETRVLLVCNNRTTAKELNKWRNLLNNVLSFGENDRSDVCTVWNTSLYRGTSLQYAPIRSPNSNEKSLAELFSDRGQLVVFLNNNCTPRGIRMDGSQSTVVEDMQKQELYHALRDTQCHAYVFGARPDMRIRTRVPVDGIYERELANENEVLAETIRTLRPDKTHLARHCLNKGGKGAAAAVFTADAQGYVQFKFKGLIFRTRYLTLRLSSNELTVFRQPLSKVAHREFHISDISDMKLDLEGKVQELFIFVPNGTIRLRASKDPNEPQLQQWHDEIQSAMANLKLVNDELEQPDHQEYGMQWFCSMHVVKRTVGVTEKNLRVRAEALAAKLHMQHPEMDFLVVYRHVAKENQVKNRGIGLNARCLGKLEIHAGLTHNEGAAVVHGPTENEEGIDSVGHYVREHIMDESNLYGVLKSFSIYEKMRLLRAAPQSDKRVGDHSLLGLLVSAIASDCADENARFRFGVTSGLRKLSTLFNMKKRKVEVTDWEERLVVLREVTSADGVGKVEIGSKKHDEVLRLMSLLEILTSKGVKRHMTTLKVSRMGMISRASRRLLDSMTEIFVEGVGIAKKDALTNSNGKHLKKIVKQLMNEGIEEGDGKMKRRDVLSALRVQHGIGIPGSATENGEFMLTVIDGNEFDVHRNTIEASSRPKIDERGGVYGSDQEYQNALKLLQTQCVSVFD